MPVSVAHVETTEWTRRGSVRFRDATDRSLDDGYAVGSKRRRVRPPTPCATFDKTTDRDSLDDDYDRCSIAERGEDEAAAAVDSGSDEIPVHDFLDDEAVSDADFLDDSDDEAADTVGVANSDCDDGLQSDDGEDLGSEDTWSNGSSFGGDDLEDGGNGDNDNASIASFVVNDDAAIEYASDFTDDEDDMEAGTDDYDVDDVDDDDDNDRKANENLNETSASDAATTVAERLAVTDETEDGSAVSCPAAAAAADNDETVDTFAKRDDVRSTSASLPSSRDT